MRLKPLLTVFLCFFIAVLASGQSTPQFTQYFFDPLAYNPAIAGSEQGFSGTIIYRQQWVGFAGAPGTGVVNVHQPIHKLKSGVGLSLMSDQIGNFKFINVAPAYAYKIRSGVNVLSFGIAPSIVSASVTDNWLAVDNKTNDPSIPQGAQRSTSIDFNAGAFYKGGKYFAGLSVNNLLGQRIEQVNLNLTRTLFLLGGYQFKFSDAIDWTAGFMYRMPLGAGAASQLDLNLSGVIREAFVVGVNYRSKDSFSPVLGYQKYVASGKIRIGYAYDYNTSTLRKGNSGSHEIAVNYLYIINRSVENEKYKNVRFL
ncbi:MAG: type IX secretion system membrane protein PorP/SprF [Bacteroidota bacterium]